MKANELVQGIETMQRIKKILLLCYITQTRSYHVYTSARKNSELVHTYTVYPVYPYCKYMPNAKLPNKMKKKIVISTLGNKIEFIARPFFYSRGFFFTTKGLPEVEKRPPRVKKAEI